MKKRVSILLIAILIFSLSLNGQTEGSIQREIHNIHFKVYGKGFPVLIINGGPGMNSDGFQNLAQTLGKKYRTIIYDQRGTGQSRIEPANSKTITMDSMVKDIETLREHLNIKSWVILGHSFGGMLGAYYASKHPSRLNGLILSSSGGLDMGLFSRINLTANLSKSERDSLAYWNNQIANGNSTFKARYQRGMNLAPAYVQNRSHIRTIAHRLTQGNSSINSLVYRNLRAIDFDCTKELENFETPTLIINGKNDFIDRETIDLMVSTIKASELIMLNNCGHYGWLDQPKDYFKALHSFLEPLMN